MNMVFYPVQVFLLALALGFVGGFASASNLIELNAPQADGPSAAGLSAAGVPQPAL